LRGIEGAPANEDQDKGDDEPEKQGINAKQILLQEATYIMGDAAELLRKPSRRAQVQSLRAKTGPLL